MGKNTEASTLRRGTWARIPGFTEWLKKEAPALTNTELIAKIAEKWKVNNVTVNAVNGLRKTYRVGLNVDAMKRSREEVRAKVMGAKIKPEQNPIEALEAQGLREHIRKLTKKQTFYEMVGQSIVEAVQKLPKLFPPHQPMKFVMPKDLSDEEMVMLISDVQIGQRVDVSESGGLGNYSTEIFLEQLEYFKQATLKISRYHPNVRKLHVWFLGDIVEGETIFSGQMRSLDRNVIEQTILAEEQFTRFLIDLKMRFEEIECAGVIGNHGRIGKYGEHSPLSNFDYLAYHYMSTRLANVRGISWTVPKSWWHVGVANTWKFLLVHGDDTGPGTWGLPYYAVDRHKSRYRELFEKLTPGKGFNYLCIGHHSRAAAFNEVLMNGSWPGGTEFSLKRLQLGDLPTQTLFGVHKSHGVTWRREVNLRPLPPRPQMWSKREGQAIYSLERGDV
jgi:hypothetical protein